MKSASPEKVEFSLAPMSGALLVMTVILLALPALFLWLAVAVAPGFLVPAVFLLLGYTATWLLLRPSGFVVLRDGFLLKWPLRSQTVPASDIVDVRLLSGRDFRREYGNWGIRIGAGGLWGAFGRLKTRKGTLSMYVSRSNDLVQVRRKSGRSLLVTPEDPARFVTLLERTLARD